MHFLKDELSIGEMSSLFQLDTQTLRYYDSIGLFSPKERDDKTRIRRYQFEQAYQLASIRFLRQMDCTLEEVQEYLSTDDMDDTLEILQKQSCVMRQKWEKMRMLQCALDEKVAFVRQALAGVQLGQPPVVRELPERKHIHIGEELLVYQDELFYMAPAMVFVENGEKMFSAYVANEAGAFAQYLMEKYTLQTLPAGRFLCGYHKGAYNDVKVTEALMRHSAAGLKLAPYSVLVNIVDMFTQVNVKEFITAVQIPVLP